MLRQIELKSVFVGMCMVASLSACDEGQDRDPVEAQLQAESAVEDIEVDWDAVPLPPAVAAAEGLDIQIEQAPTAGPGGWQFEIENFSLTTNDIFALTGAPGGLFAPIPAGIAAFDEPILAPGFMIASKIFNDEGEVIGFGTEQEILDFQNLSAKTTYTLTLPGRGTLMVEQDEDLSFLIDEVSDMVMDGEFVRSYETPLVNENSIPGTGRVIGGTGEFEHAKGVVREIGIINELNLITGVHDLEVIVQVALLPNG